MTSLSAWRTGRAVPRLDPGKTIPVVQPSRWIDTSLPDNFGKLAE
jgi:hypothetical protein